MYSKTSDEYAVSHKRHQLEYIVLSLFFDIRKFYPQIEAYFKDKYKKYQSTYLASEIKRYTIYGLTAEIIVTIINDKELGYINPNSSFEVSTNGINKILRNFKQQQAIAEINKELYIKKALTRHQSTREARALYKSIETHTPYENIHIDKKKKYDDQLLSGKSIFYLKGENYDNVLKEIIDQLREDLDIGTNSPTSPHGLPNSDRKKNTFILSDKMIKRVSSQWYEIFCNNQENGEPHAISS